MSDICKQDLDDIKELFKAQLDQLHVLINANDKNYNQRFENVIQATQAALAAADRAVNKAETASEKRFDAVNEFRNTLSDQQRNLMPRNEVEIITKSIAERLEKMENLTLLATGKGAGVNSSWGIIIGGVSIVGIVIALLLNAIRLFGGG